MQKLSLDLDMKKLNISIIIQLFFIIEMSNEHNNTVCFNQYLDVYMLF